MDKSGPLNTNNSLVNPLVSVVMCTYNGSKFLHEQIQSIIEQTYRPIEIIVVDDCSTDNTWELLKEWEKNYPEIFRLYLNDKNLGYNKNFEKGIQFATGEYIAISDQDDIWMPEKISELVDCLKNNDASMSHCKNVTLTNGELKNNHTNLRNFFVGKDVRKLFLYSQFSGHAILFRRSLIDKIIPFPNGIIYDWWIGVNACVNGGVSFADKVLVYHRVHYSNATTQVDKSSKTCSLDIDEMLSLFINIENMNPIHKSFLIDLIEILRNHKNNFSGKVNWHLFTFFFINRKIIYSHKKRRFPIFSQIKHAFKLSKKPLNGIGGVI